MTTTISLIVKGDKTVATDTAKAHDVPFTFVREIRHKIDTGKGPGDESVETVGLTSSDHANSVIAWYGESDRAPFAPGSLLLYTWL